MAKLFGDIAAAIKDLGPVFWSLSLIIMVKVQIMHNHN